MAMASKGAGKILNNDPTALSVENLDCKVTCNNEKSDHSYIALGISWYNGENVQVRMS